VDLLRDVERVTNSLLSPAQLHRCHFRCHCRLSGHFAVLVHLGALGYLNSFSVVATIATSVVFVIIYPF
jgi:hypothetical protein